MRLRHLMVGGLLVLSTASTATADKLCILYPMYPYGGGGNWLHYAERRSDNCTNPSATPWIGPYTTSQLPCTGCYTVRLDNGLFEEFQLPPVDRGFVAFYQDDGGLEPLPADANANRANNDDDPPIEEDPGLRTPVPTDHDPTLAWEDSELLSKLKMALPVVYARLITPSAGKPRYIACYRYLMAETVPVHQEDDTVTQVEFLRLLAFGLECEKPEPGTKVVTLVNAADIPGGYVAPPNGPPEKKGSVPKKGIYRAQLPSENGMGVPTDFLILTTVE